MAQSHYLVSGAVNCFLEDLFGLLVYFRNYLNYFIAATFTLSVCTKSCADDKTCQSAIYDEQLQKCYLYNTTINVKVENSTSTLVYLRKADSCNWVDLKYPVRYHVF